MFRQHDRLTLLIMKTSYDPSYYTSSRYVLHKRSASRRWSLNTICQHDRSWSCETQLSLGYIDSHIVDEIRQFGFSEDQSRKTLSQSNNNLTVVADILLTPLDQKI